MLLIRIGMVRAALAQLGGDVETFILAPLRGPGTPAERLQRSFDGVSRLAVAWAGGDAPSGRGWTLDVEDSILTTRPDLGRWISDDAPGAPA